MEIALPILGKSAAGFIIGKLLTAAASYLKGQYFWKTNLEEELKNLQHLLPQIQAVVDFAERKPITDQEALEKWLWQFRDGIDEAEEVLDDLEYIELEKKANADKTKLSKAVDASIRIAKRVLKLDDVLERLRKCVQNLSSTARDAEKFSRLVSSSRIEEYQHQQPHPVAGERITTSLPASTLFEGREKEKQIIIQKLMEESESDTWNVRVLPLVGMGGIGKTTLAQQVYKHFEDGKHFDVRIWVCVSTDFNVAGLTKKILESITDDKSDYENLDRLQTKIREILQVKRFLLVLDDAWNDSEQGDWERLCAPLQQGRKGSRILLTTRSSSVIKMVSTVMRGTMKQMDLGGLSNDECRSLLYHCAFVNEDPAANPHLTRVGEEIIVKLQGIPLLAKTIGGVLGSKLDLEHWRRVLENEVWEIPQNSKEDFIPALRLSYHMLSPLLKQCFGYCSLFPQDYRFEKKKLVSMWVAAGVIQPQQSEGSEEDIAGECFDMLCAKSLFDAHPSYTGYHIMHDMLHGLACHVSRHECCRIMHDQPKNIPHTIRHLLITCTFDELPKRTKMVEKLRHLRTLFIDYHGHAQKLYDFIQQACTTPRSIRVLVIKFDGSISFDKRWLDNFVNLRFLHLSISSNTKLPESVCRFYFLQILDIRYDWGSPYYLEPPSGMNKLTNLMHFHGHISTVSKVGKLTCLQELDEYRVGTKDGYRIDELKDMNDLRHLEIYDLHNVQRIEEANRANLQMKKKLSSLTLSWLSVAHNSVPEHDYQVLAALNPPPHITELKIEDYRAGKSAPWMSTPSLCYLQSVKIWSCPGWEELPPLWEFALLKHLWLYNMDAVRRFGPESSNSNGVDKTLFPSLEKLYVRNLPRLQEWDDADDYIWFPHLKELHILYCLELRKIPCLPFSLECFNMVEVGLTSLPRSYTTNNDPRTLGRFRELMSLRAVRILECPEILYSESTGEEEDGNLLPSSLTQLEIVDVQGDTSCRYLGGLTMLSYLSLKSYRGMAALPSADHLTSLWSLCLYECNDLISLRGLHSITSLGELEIRDCPRLLEDTVDLPASLTLLQLTRCNVCHKWLSRCLQGLTSLSTLKILGCPKILSLPKAELLHHLTALETLELDECDELQEVDSLRALASLESLRISGCPKLLAAASSTQQPSADEQRETQKERGTSQSLRRIDIDNILYLLILPARKGIVSIHVYNRFSDDEDYLPKFNLIPEVIENWLLQCHDSLQYLELGGMPCLQSLPASLESFSKLKSLSLPSARQLESLPRMPASLERLYIRDCNPSLKKRCQENTGDDWPNIKHIPRVEINTDTRYEIQEFHTIIYDDVRCKLLYNLTISIESICIFTRLCHSPFVRNPFFQLPSTAEEPSIGLLFRGEWLNW